MRNAFDRIRRWVKFKVFTNLCRFSAFDNATQPCSNWKRMLTAEKTNQKVQTMKERGRETNRQKETMFTHFSCVPFYFRYSHLHNCYELLIEILWHFILRLWSCKEKCANKQNEKSKWIQILLELVIRIHITSKTIVSNILVGPIERKKNAQYDIPNACTN